MAKPSVLLVVGAGASVGAGFPTNRELKMDIIYLGWRCINVAPNSSGLSGTDPQYISDFLGSHVPKRARLDQVEVTFRNMYTHDLGLVTQIAQLTAAFCKVPREQIDLFMAGRPDLRQAGRFLVTMALAIHENDLALTSPLNTDAWLEQLFERTLRAGDDDISHLRFVTFNYDRVIERTLVRLLQEQFRKTPQEISNYLSQLNILHVHGMAGSIADPEASDFRAWGDVSYEGITRASSSLGFFSDGLAETLKVRLMSLLNSPSQAYFLGFAFQKDNVLKFYGSCLSSTQHFGYTNVEINTRDFQIAYRWLTGRTALPRDLGPDTRCSKLIAHSAVE